MAAKRDQTIITYSGLDGACAAAMVLLQHPHADLMVSSSSSIAYTLEMMARGRRSPAEIHICGMGVSCEWDGLVDACRALADKGAQILWYCGRGYLDDQRDRFAEVCSPVFVDCASNTEAVCRHLGLRRKPLAQFLLKLALRDTALNAPSDHANPEEEFWCDFINGSSLQYFKYMDRTAYIDAVRKLSKGEKDEKARQVAKVFQRTGAKYVLLGRSRVLAQLKERVRKCAEPDEHVLINGETGTGKEWVAHLVHERSARATEAFVPINCATFIGSGDLANSELFGHMKGAFTGATTERKGKLVTANRGILFLDELGELPPEVQAKLLRVIDDGEVIPVGADRATAKVNVRVVAATNRDLPKMVREGRFREDLFHRLNVLRIPVPPLRDHSHDIPQIAAKTLAEIPPEYRARRLTRDDMRLLREYSWPGNVRQLIQLLKRWAYLGLPLAQLVAEERQLALSVGTGAAQTRGLLPHTQGDIKPLNEVRREYAQRALELHDGNITAAAKGLGIAVNTLKKCLAP